ncbi:hypothetical protein ABIE38_000630 [Dietzia sp. 2505]
MLLLLGAVGVSVGAWRGVFPIEGGLRPEELPAHFMLLTLSLMLFLVAELSGSVLLWRTTWSERTITMCIASIRGLIAAYGMVSTVVFARAAESAWAWSAVIPVAFMAYVVRMEIGLRREIEPLQAEARLLPGQAHQEVDRSGRLHGDKTEARRLDPHLGPGEGDGAGGDQVVARP